MGKPALADRFNYHKVAIESATALTFGRAGWLHRPRLSLLDYHYLFDEELPVRIPSLDP